MTTPSVPAPNPAPAPALISLEARVQSLTTIIKALVRQHGQPEATQPLSITVALTAHQLEEAHALIITISPQPATDIQPEPWLLLTLEGI